jgi:predicted nucleic acid-binding protein
MRRPLRRILIDLGILLSDYQPQEPRHQVVVAFFDTTATQLITSPMCIAEVLWLLGDPGDSRVRAAQSHLLNAVAARGI